MHDKIFEELIAKSCTPERTPNWSDDWNETHPLWEEFYKNENKNK